MTSAGHGSDIVVCSVDASDERQVLRYDVKEYETPTGGKRMSSSASCSYNASLGVTSMRFVRSLNAESMSERSIPLADITHVIFAHGSQGQNKLQYHTSYGSVAVDFGTGKHLAPEVPQIPTLLLLHIICMALSWGSTSSPGNLVSNSGQTMEGTASLVCGP